MKLKPFSTCVPERPFSFLTPVIELPDNEGTPPQEHSMQPPSTQLLLENARICRLAASAMRCGILITKAFELTLESSLEPDLPPLYLRLIIHFQNELSFSRPALPSDWPPDRLPESVVSLLHAGTVCGMLDPFFKTAASLCSE